MEGWRTRGHAAAVRAAAAMVRGPAPHAVLLVGPAGVGKTTLAADMATGLLCVGTGAARPCGDCRGCRLVARETHPDLHYLRPEGPGRQVVIGGPGSKARGVRDLIAELALLPVEGRARVAIIDAAHRMNDDAQAALLKTLEEPPAGVTIILCADAEEPLLPTIRSRCARLRLGPVGPRDVEAILGEHGVPDPGLAARLARLSGGRPGRALAWASDPDAVRLRDELGHTLVDLIAARPAERLAAIRSAATRGGTLADILDGAMAAVPPNGDAAARAVPAGDDPEADPAAAEPSRAPAAQRRRAADALVAVWTDVARDLLMVRVGAVTTLHDPRSLEELTSAAERIDLVELAGFVERLGQAAVLLSNNVAPELVLDDLAIAWPSSIDVAA